MKFCPACGQQLVDEAVICINCGVSQQQQQPAVNPKDKKSFGFGFLGFISPLVGLVIYLLTKDTTPLKAKSAGIGAIVGTVFAFIVGILYGIIFAYVISTDPELYYEEFYEEAYTLSTMLF